MTTPTLPELIITAVNARLLDLHVCLPARVETYDPAQQKADVKPLLKKRYNADGKPAELPVIASVPVQWPSAGNGSAYIHLPIKSGDLGMVIFCERSLDNWLSGTGQIVTPDDPRHHDISDGIFIPGVRPFGTPLADVPADNLRLQNSLLRIELDPSGKISIEGAADELLTVISDVIGHVAGATVVIPGGSSAGTYPLDPAAVASLTADKTRIDGLKR